jgi:putative mRNA 3-end processing factor
MNLLLEDYIKVAKLTRGFSEYSSFDIIKMNKNFRPCTYNKKFRIKDFNAILFDAFHIPGSASLYLTNSKRILYTGDISMHSTYLLECKSIKYPKVDCLIIESTYSEKDHPDRREEERKFINKVSEYSDGLVLIPTFAVGRAQEILLILAKHNITKNIYLDGMAQKASNIILYHKHSIRDHRALKNILMKVKFVRTRKQRDKILKSGGIVVTTSGMLNGGPIVYYLKKVRNRRDACLLFTGFQVEGTPGEKLLKTKIFESEEEKFEVNIEVKKFDFSAHAGRSELFNLVEKVNPKKVICVHGDHTRKFAREIREILGIEAIAPRIDEKVEI